MRLHTDWTSDSVFYVSILHCTFYNIKANIISFEETYNKPLVKSIHTVLLLLLKVTRAMIITEVSYSIYLSQQSGNEWHAIYFNEL